MKKSELKNIIKEVITEETSKLSVYDIEDIMAQSGKTKVRDLLDYMKYRYPGKYDPKDAKVAASNIVKSIRY